MKSTKDSQLLSLVLRALITSFRSPYFIQLCAVFNHVQCACVRACLRARNCVSVKTEGASHNFTRFLKAQLTSKEVRGQRRFRYESAQLS